MKRFMKNNESSGVWTLFMDMHSGEGCKLYPYEYIYPVGECYEVPVSCHCNQGSSNRER